MQEKPINEKNDTRKLVLSNLLDKKQLIKTFIY